LSGDDGMGAAVMTPDVVLAQPLMLRSAKLERGICWASLCRLVQRIARMTPRIPSPIATRPPMTPPTIAAVFDPELELFGLDVAELDGALVKELLVGADEDGAPAGCMSGKSSAATFSAAIVSHEPFTGIARYAHCGTLVFCGIGSGKSAIAVPLKGQCVV